MKKFGLILALTLLTLPPLIAQVSNPSIIVVSSAPSGSCGGSGLPMQYVFSTGVLYACQNGTWGQIGGGGGGGPYLPLAGGTMTGPAYMDGPIYDARAMGLKCDGVTDDTAALNAADATLQANGGGTIRFPPHSKTLLAGHIVLPNDNTNWEGAGFGPISRQVPIRWEGTSPDARNGQRFTPNTLYSGSELLMTYAGTGATGGLEEQSVYAGGSGYVVGDTGTVGGTCSGTTYTVEAVDTGTYTVGTAGSTLTHSGYVEQVYISNDGSGCTVADNTATSTGGAQPGSGTGLTLNIADVAGSDFAKIETYGTGYFEMDHLLLYDTGSDSLPFFRTTFTTVDIHDNQFWGTCVSNACKQDALVLGGTTYYTGTGAQAPLNSPLMAFGGFDSKIENNEFNAIRRAIYTQKTIAATLVMFNYVNASAGTNIPEGGAFVSNNPIIDSVTGVANGANGGENFYAFNRFEMLGYPYAVKLLYSLSNVIENSDMEDINDGPVTPYGFINYQHLSMANLALVLITGGLPAVIADTSLFSSGVGSNTLLSSQSSTPSYFPNGLSTGHFTSSGNQLAPGSVALLPATVSTTDTSKGFEFDSTYWNGSASAPDVWLVKPAVSTGTNGATTLVFSHPAGSSGLATVKMSGIALDLNGAAATAAGGWSFSSAPEFTSNAYFDQPIYLRNQTAATSGANQSSPLFYKASKYWTGSASATDYWSVNVALASGSNPIGVYNILHNSGGSPGAVAVGVPGISANITYSVAGTALPSCAAATKGWKAMVSDATLATPGSAYAGSGTYTIWVECVYNSTGPVYSWNID